MDESTRDGITWVLGTLTTTILICAFAVRFILLPWLRDHLTGPVADVRRQVTENEHKHTPPTIPDRIEGISSDVTALTRALDGHLESGDRWLEHITDRIETLETRVATMLSRRGEGDRGRE